MGYPKGYKYSAEARLVAYKTRRGENHPDWKGNDVTKESLHQWLRRNHGRANKCVMENCEGVSKVFHWSLLHGKEYIKDIQNFRQLCAQCHVRYDGNQRSASQSRLTPIIGYKGNEKITFGSATEAEKTTGISQTAINNCLKGRSKSAGKIRWEYAF